MFAESSSFLLAKKVAVQFFTNFLLGLLNRHLSYWPRKVAGQFFLQIFSSRAESSSYWHYHSQVIYRAYFSHFFIVSVKKNGNSVTTNILCIVKPSMDLYFAIWTMGVHVFNIFCLRNAIGNPLVFCFHHTLKWAIKLIKTFIRIHGQI